MNEIYVDFINFPLLVMAVLFSELQQYLEIEI